MVLQHLAHGQNRFKTRHLQLSHSVIQDDINRRA